MLSENSQNSIEISRKVASWLNSKAEEGEVLHLLNIFLLGETLQQSMGYVLSYKKTLDSSITLEGKKLVKFRKNVFEILPFPEKEEMDKALEEIQNLNISDASVPTKDLYLENPFKARKDRMTFILGE